MSVVITSYNYARYLRQCVQSAVQQTYPTEVIVVDDASVDHSLEVLRSFGSRIMVIDQKKRQGQGAAMNRGIAASSGEIVITLDSDDWMSPHRAERVVEVFRRNPDADWLIHKVTATTGSPDDGETTYLVPRPETVVDDLMRHGDIAGTTSGFAFRRSLLDRMGKIPESFGIYPDSFLACAAALLGQLTVLEESLTYQRVHPARASGQRNGAGDRAYRLIMMHRELARQVAVIASENPALPHELRAGTTWWQQKAELQAAKSDAVCSTATVCRSLVGLARALRVTELPALRRCLILLREVALTASPRGYYLQLWFYTHHGRPQRLAPLVARVVVTAPDRART